MKTARKTLASLLSLLMVLSCCTVLFPAFAGAEGQNDDVVTKAVINIGAVNDNGWGKDNYPAYIYYGKDANCASAVGGNWFTWWYKTRWTWNVESHSFVATALSSNGDTAYESWVLDDYEFVSMIYSGTETYADDRDALMNVAVGDKAWIYGFDFTNEKDNALIADGVSSVKLALGEKLAEGEPFDIAEETPCPGYFTDVDNPELHGLDNLARAEGTSITYNNVDASGTYTGDIADGTVGPADYTNTWRGFRQDGNVMFDFGSVREDIGSVDIFTWPANKSGIVKPERIAVEASIDGVNWFTAYESTDFSADKWNAKDNNAIKETISFEKLLAGRYIKVTVSGSWVFVSEIQVNAHTEYTGDENPPKAVISIGAVNDNGWGKDGYPAYIYYGKGADCESAVGGNYFSYWYKIRWTWDMDTHSFIATALSAKGDTAYESWVLDVYEFVSVVYSGTETYAADLKALTNVVVGDRAYIYGFDFTNEKAVDLIVDGESPVKLALGGKLEDGKPFDVAPYMPGDVDGDGEITMVDCLYLKRYILGTFSGSMQLKNADVDGNGRIDATDYLYLKRGYLGTFDLSKFA